MKARFLIIILIFFALQAFSQESLIKAEKLYGLSLFWQEVNYNFAYFDQVPDLDWDGAYHSAIDEVLETQSDYEYYKVLQKLAARLNDGHTEVYYPDHIAEKFVIPNIKVASFDDAFYIVNISPLLKNKLPVGSKLIAVNQQSINDYLVNEIFPYVSSSTAEAKQAVALQKMFVGFENTQYVLEVETPKGKSVTYTLELNKELTRDWVKALKKTSFYTKKIKDYTYVNLPSFEQAEIVAAFKSKIDAINASKGLVIDLRDNVGGQAVVALNIAQYLLKDDLVVDMPWKSKQHIASLKAWGNSGLQKVGYESVSEYKDFGDTNAWISVASDTLQLDPYRPKITVPITILTGVNTASSAENFLVFARQNDEITTIGSPTFGSTGQPIYFTLPGDAIARICAKRNYDIDGSEFVGKGIQPDVFLQPNLQDVISNNDVELQKAIELMRKP